MARRQEQNFSRHTQRTALVRQQKTCGSCGAHIEKLGSAGRKQHKYGEGAQAHHMEHAKFGGTNSEDNCVVLCDSCHYTAHEGGNYRHGTVQSTADDYPHFRGSPPKGPPR